MSVDECSPGRKWGEMCRSWVTLSMECPTCHCYTDPQVGLPRETERLAHYACAHCAREWTVRWTAHRITEDV